mmetsp:Transcript_15306/g.46245  ORF Transcript_15306/g.46245 Transcript_15306/m.46245 type:complete len:270 (+) Transcript_15306:274-1083(+)
MPCWTSWPDSVWRARCRQLRILRQRTFRRFANRLRSSAPSSSATGRAGTRAAEGSLAAAAAVVAGISTKQVDVRQIASAAVAAEGFPHPVGEATDLAAPASVVPPVEAAAVLGGVAMGMGEVAMDMEEAGAAMGSAGAVATAPAMASAEAVAMVTAEGAPAGMAVVDMTVEAMVMSGGPVPAMSHIQGAPTCQGQEAPHLHRIMQRARRTCLVRWPRAWGRVAAHSTEAGPPWQGQGRRWAGWVPLAWCLWLLQFQGSPCPRSISAWSR